MKQIRSNQQETVSSSERQWEVIPLPVFNFQGEVEAGLSDRWFPPFPMRLTHGYVSATSPGSTTAGFAFMKYSTLEPQGKALSSVVMSSTTQKATLYFGDKVDITPFEWVLVASFAASGHEGVTVQVFGRKIYV